MLRIYVGIIFSESGYSRSFPKHWHMVNYKFCKYMKLDCTTCLFLCRYPDDKFDRYWFPKHVDNPYVNGTTIVTNLSTTTIVPTSWSNESVPSSVMQTCLAMSTPGNMTFYFPLRQASVKVYLAFYWAELDGNVNVTSRQFMVHVPGFTPDLLFNIYNQGGGLYSLDEEAWWNFTLTPQTSKIVQYSTPTSVYGPILNALELFAITDVISSTTNIIDGEWPTSSTPF